MSLSSDFGGGPSGLGLVWLRFWDMFLAMMLMKLRGNVYMLILSESGFCIDVIGWVIFD